MQVLVGREAEPRRSRTSTFFVTPDGKHLILQDQLLDFGPHPYENNFHTLEQRASGPSRGAKGKQF